jgi:ferredoxin-NADP reductase
VEKLVLTTRTVVRATPRTRLLTLALNNDSFAFTAGQAVYAGLADGSVRRPYSIASSPIATLEAGALQLLVQIDDHSAPDPHLERVTAGTRVSVEGPFGSFGLPLPVSEPHVMFVAGGTGIAPLRSMLGELLARQPDLRPTLLYSARSGQEFAFREELEAMADSGRLDLQLTVTRDRESTWSGMRGRFEGRHLRSALKTADTRCLVCGPPGLVTDTVAFLKAAGVAEERIGWEAF